MTYIVFGTGTLALVSCVALHAGTFIIAVLWEEWEVLAWEGGRVRKRRSKTSVELSADWYARFDGVCG